MTVQGLTDAVALGAHAYLVFMAGFRLKMATAPQTFERF